MNRVIFEEGGGEVGFAESVWVGLGSYEKKEGKKKEER